MEKKISSEFIDNIYEKALKSGSLGGKILGAGGGGFFLFYVAPFQKNVFLKAMKTKGFDHTRFQFDDTGMQAWTNRIIED